LREQETGIKNMKKRKSKEALIEHSYTMSCES